MSYLLINFRASLFALTFAAIFCAVCSLMPLGARTFRPSAAVTTICFTGTPMTLACMEVNTR